MVLLLFTIWTSIWMWAIMSQKGGLGQEEEEVMKELKQRQMRERDEI